MFQDVFIVSSLPLRLTTVYDTFIPKTSKTISILFTFHYKPADLHYGATAVNCYMTETHMIPGTFLKL